MRLLRYGIPSRTNFLVCVPVGVSNDGFQNHDANVWYGKVLVLVLYTAFVS